MKNEQNGYTITLKALAVGTVNMTLFDSETGTTLFVLISVLSDVSEGDSIRKEWIRQHMDYATSATYQTDIVPGYQGIMYDEFKKIMDDPGIKIYDATDAVINFLNANKEDTDQSTLYELLLAELMYSSLNEDAAAEIFSNNLQESTTSYLQEIYEVVSISDDIIGETALKNLTDALTIMEKADVKSKDYSLAYKEFTKTLSDNLEPGSVTKTLKNSATNLGLSLAFDAVTSISSSAEDTINYMVYAVAYSKTSNDFKNVMIALREKIVRELPPGSFGELNEKEKAINWSEFARAIDSFVERMELSREKGMQDFVKEKIQREIADGAAMFAENATKSMAVFTVDFACSCIPVLNTYPAIKAALSAGKMVIELLSDIDEQSYRLDMVTKLYCISVALDSVADDYAKMLDDDYFWIATAFDETISLYKTSMLQAIGYMQKYEKSAFASAYTNSATYYGDLAKQTAKHWALMDALANSKIKYESIMCHDAALNYVPTIKEIISPYEDSTLYIIACPVEVTVTSEEGEIIALMSDDNYTVAEGYEWYYYTLQTETDEILKVAMVPENYNISINGTDEGTMNIVVAQFNDSEECDLQYFHGIPVNEETVGYFESKSNGTSGKNLIVNDVKQTEFTEEFLHTHGEPEFHWNDQNKCAVYVTCTGCGHTQQAECIVTGVSVPAGGKEAEKMIYTATTEIDGITYTDTRVIYDGEIHFSITQEYIVLNIGESVSLRTEVIPEELTADVKWSTEDSQTDIISVDKSGLVIAKELGTSYVIATITDDKGDLHTARCRVDVANPIDLNGVTLSTNKLTAELYSTEYAEFDIALLLPQNLPAQAASVYASQEAAMAGTASNSVAIENVRFTDEAANELFKLVAKDDRTVKIVPTEAALDTPKAVPKSFKSTVTVTVQGMSYETEVLTVTVKQTLPKLKVTIPAFNNFWSGQTQEIAVTGATVTGISCENLPGWLELNGTTMALNENVPAKGGSAKLTLLVETEEWAVPIETALTVKCSYKAPGLKLNTSNVQMSADEKYSDGVELTLMSKDKKQALHELRIREIAAPEGYEIYDFNNETGTFRLKAESRYVQDKIKLEVYFCDTDETVSLPLKVKFSNVKLKLSRNAITLNSSTGDSAVIDVSVTPTDYRLTEPEIALTNDESIDRSESGELDVRYEEGRLYISTTEITPDNAKYIIYICARYHEDAILRISTTNATPTLKLKSVGNLDLSFPEQRISLAATFKNHSGGNIQAVDYRVTETKGKDVLSEDVKAFALTKEGRDLYLSIQDGSAINVKNTYTLHLSLMMEDNTPLEASVKIPVKQTAVALKMSANKLTLNKAINDKASVTVTCATKDYRFTEPVWTLRDSKGNDASGQLDISWDNGKLTVATTETTPYGTSYNLMIAPEKDAKAVTLAIKIPAEAKSTVTGTLKATGNLDVIRDGTALTVTPTWKNCNDAERTEELKIFCGDEDVTNRFVITEEDGKYILTRGADLDHTQKYTATLTATFANGTTATASGVLKLKMGSAKLTVNTDGTTLFANDKHSRVNVSFASSDITLNKVAKVTLDPKLQSQFELFDYGNGQYAIGFKDGTVPAKLTSANISLNVWLDGNKTVKANASLKVKISIVR